MPSKDMYLAGLAMFTLFNIILFLTIDHLFFLVLISLSIIGLGAISIQKELEEKFTVENKYE